MITPITTKQVLITKYVTTDGKEFTTELEANSHQWKLEATKVWTVTRGGAIAGIFSTETLAKAFVASRSFGSYDITCHYLDEYTRYL